jgi:3-hydroxy-9,10-secoandrosta-1,3,5(10)-triene-9,17-dione monooxygenase
MKESIDQFLRGDFSGSELVQRARALVPTLRERYPEQWQQPRLMKETVQELKDAGLFRMYQPRRWGGAEATPIEAFEATSILAEADPSVAWVLGVIGIHSFHMAFFDPRAQEEVWGDDPTVLVSSPYAPGKAMRVPGGFRLSGRWSFSSGCDHCEWTFLGGNVEGEAPGTTAQSGLPAYAFLLPRSDYEIVPNWDVHGLRATGSHDIVVTDAFIPEHRALAWSAVLNGEAPGLKVNQGALYKLPFFQIFSRATQPPSALGALKGLVDTFLAFNQSKVSNRGVPAAKNPTITLHVAECLSLIEEMRGQVYRNYAQLLEAAVAGTQVPLNERRAFRFQSSQIPTRCARLANELYRIMGGTAIYESRPFGRYLNDLLAIQTHGLNNFQVQANFWIGALLGDEESARNPYA